MAEPTPEKIEAADELFRDIESQLLLEDLEETLLRQGPVAPKPTPPKKAEKVYTLKPHLTQKPLRGNPKLLDLQKELKRR